MRPLLGTAEARDCLLRILEECRVARRFHVLAYVAMPEHVHLLISEPGVGKVATVMQVVKQRFSRTRDEKDVWEPRYYDFNVKTEFKREEKMHYVHLNPVRRGLVKEPGEWAWSSYRSYALGEPGLVKVTRTWER